MNITIIAIANGLLVLLTVAALTAVTQLGLRLHPVPAESTELRREPARRAAA